MPLVRFEAPISYTLRGFGYDISTLKGPPRVGETPGFGPLGVSEGDFHEISTFSRGRAAPARGPRRIEL